MKATGMEIIPILAIDPVDNETFWFNGEYFSGGSRLNKVGVFKLAPQYTIDVGVTEIIAPVFFQSWKPGTDNGNH